MFENILELDKGQDNRIDLTTCVHGKISVNFSPTLCTVLILAYI